MFDAIQTFWVEFLGENVSASFLTSLCVLTAVCLLYGLLIRPLIGCINRDERSFLHVYDIILAVIVTAYCIFNMSPTFLSFSAPDNNNVTSVESVESTLSSEAESVESEVHYIPLASTNSEGE